MSQLSLNLVAISIFAMTLSTLLGPLVHLSPVVPAIATAGVLGLATLDTFSWQGQGSNLLLDWLAGFSSQHRDRVLHHEAAHFLVAHQLGIPVTGYALTAWEAMRQGHPGQGAVRFGDPAIAAALQQGTLPVQLLDRYCTIWMAGIAAETMLYGNVEGGGDDRQTLRSVLATLQISAAERQQKERWAIMRAKTLLQEQQPAYDALVAAMQQRLTVEACCGAIDHVQS